MARPETQSVEAADPSGSIFLAKDPTIREIENAQLELLLSRGDTRDLGLGERATRYAKLTNLKDELLRQAALSA